jgi:hypothetical protein
MSTLGDILKFEGFNLKTMLKKAGDDPERLFLGAADPAGSKFWGKVTGKDYEPIVDQWGGASNDTYDKAHAAGVRTGPGKTMHHIARAIAAWYAGGYGLNALGGAAAAGGGGAAATGGGGAAAGGSAVPSTFIPGVDSAALGSSGAATGPSSVNLVNAGGTMETGLGGAGGFNLQQMRQWNSATQPQQQREDKVDPAEYEAPSLDAYMARAKADLQPSSKTLKTPARSLGGSLGDAIQRGVRGEDPIDSNGVEVAAIQALGDRLDQLMTRAERLVNKRKGA